MKKIQIVLLSIILTVSLASCRNSVEKEPVETEAEYRKVSLNILNYDDYICINKYFYSQVDFLTEEGYIYNKYNIYTDVHIETSKKKQCYFENVEIVFERTVFRQPKQYIAQLDVDGYSHISYLDFDMDVFFREYSDDLVVSSISGYVYVPVD